MQAATKLCIDPNAMLAVADKGHVVVGLGYWVPGSTESITVRPVGGSGSRWERLHPHLVAVHKVPLGKEMSARCHLLISVSDKSGVFPGSAFDSAMHKVSLPLRDVVFSTVAGGSLD